MILNGEYIDYEPMVSISVGFPPRVHDWITALAREKSCSKAEIVRAIVTGYMSDRINEEVA